jgi:hypothetical protein
MIKDAFFPKNQCGIGLSNRKQPEVDEKWDLRFLIPSCEFIDIAYMSTFQYITGWSSSRAIIFKSEGREFDPAPGKYPFAKYVFLFYFTQKLCMYVFLKSLLKYLHTYIQPLNLNL